MGNFGVVKDFDSFVFTGSWPDSDHAIGHHELIDDIAKLSRELFEW